MLALRFIIACPYTPQPAYRSLGGYEEFPETEKIAKEIISLPIYPEFSEEDVQMIIRTIMDFSA